MAENSKIEWTDHTFNAWTGCTKVSPACQFCYAEAWAKRSGHVEWGPGKPRRRTAPAEWKKPLKWDREAGGRLAVGSGRRPRVFLNSLSDWLDDEVPVEWLRDVLHLIWSTPNLDWLLLTKRPQNWGARMEAVLKHIEAMPGWPWELLHNTDWVVFGRPPPNVWIGTTVEDQQRAEERLPELIKIPAVVRFLSCEPLLGPVDLEAALPHGTYTSDFAPKWGGGGFGPIHWVIAGGESGGNSRASHPDWFRSLRDQCGAADVPFLFKQWGDWLPAGAEAAHLPQDKAFRPDRFGDGTLMLRVGKELAGRTLEGRLWDQYPAVERRVAQ